MGQTNVDKATGIRYGVIPMSAIDEFAVDAIESVYWCGCPHCGAELNPDEISDRVVCASCGQESAVWECFGDEPIGYSYDDNEYSIHGGTDGDLFVLRSPWVTRCQFCSPCAPGAGYLLDPCDDGPRTYCLGPEWFPDNVPYPYERITP